MMDNFKSIVVVAISIAGAVVGCRSSSVPYGNPDVEMLTEAVFSKAASRLGVQSLPLNYDHSKGAYDGSIMKSCLFKVNSAHRDELSGIAKSAFTEVGGHLGFRISGSGGSNTSYWCILEKDNVELFFSVVASPMDNYLKIDIFRKIGK